MSHLSHPQSTLVMGARGHVGRYVLRGLLAAGVPVRASARTPPPDQFLPGVEVVAADLTDPASLGAAFAGMSQVFLYAHHEGVAGVIEAARAAGVHTVVLMSSGSVIHPTSRGNAITEEHREVEQAFAAATDLRVVPIRPLALATNALGWAWPIRSSRTLPLYRPDAVTAPIHERDVAAVAIEALTGAEPTTVNRLLTGPTRLSQREQVAMIATAIGVEITVAELDRDEAFARFGRFMPDHEAEAVLQFLGDADAGNSPATSAVVDVLGRPATGFDVWAADHVGDFWEPTRT